MRAWALDARATALARCALGTYALVDLLLRITAPGGLLWYVNSRQNVEAAVHGEEAGAPTVLHDYLFHRGSRELQGLLFVLHGMAAVAFTLGFRPRASAAVLWLFTVSLHGRQPALYDMSDQLLANLLLWAVFLPLTAKGSTTTTVHAGAGAAGFVLQLALVPVGHLLHREAAGAATWRNGTALYYVVAGALGTRAPLAGWFAARPAFCRLLSYGMLASEALFPVGVVLTDHRRMARGWLVAFAMASHALFYILVLDFSQWGSLWMAALLALLPSPIMDRLWCVTAEAAGKAEAVGNAEAVASASPPLAAQAAATSPGGDGLRQRRKAAAAASTFSSSPSADSATAAQDPPGAASGIVARAGAALHALVAAGLVAFMLCDAGSLDARAFAPLDTGMVAAYTGFRQGWPLLRAPSAETQHGWASMVARVPRNTSRDVLEAGALQVDIFRAMRDGDWSRNVTDAAALEALGGPSACPSCRYPTWRNERYYHASALSPFPLATSRTAQLTKHYCGMLRDYFQSEAGRRLAAAQGLWWRNAAVHSRLGRYTVNEPPKALLAWPMLLDWHRRFPPTYGEGMTLLDVVRLC